MTNKNVSVVRMDNNQITKQRAYDPKQLQLIKRTVASDTTDDEFNMFIEICKRQGLDPFRRQIYALVYNKDNADKRKVAFITGIDGYRAIAKRSGTFRPADTEPDIEYDDSAKCPDTNPRGIVKATVIVYQYAIDGWYPVVGTARWKEFAPIIEETEWKEQYDANGNVIIQQSGKWAGKPLRKPEPTGKKSMNNQNWLKMPHIMLAKCAEAQALRKGWPEEMGGLYVAEEMHKSQADDYVATEEIAAYEEEQRMRAVNAVDSIPMILSQSDGLEMIPVGKVFDTVCELIKDFDDADLLNIWKEQNRIGLQQFWARSKSDALELKKRIEDREEYLRKNPIQDTNESKDLLGDNVA